MRMRMLYVQGRWELMRIEREIKKARELNQAKLDKHIKRSLEEALEKSKLLRKELGLKDWSERRVDLRKSLTIHRPPGFALRSVAEFLFSPKTYSMVLEPVLRDLQDEYNEALARHLFWKARYVRARGYCAFWSAVWAQVSGSVVKKLLKALGVATSSPG